MAGNGTFSIELTCQGGHASQPDQCRDPVLAVITMNLQQIIARRMPPQTSAVVSMTSIDTVSGLTVIPKTSRLAGSIRLSSMNDKKTIEDLIVQISQDTVRSYGVACHVALQPRYQPTVNHAEPAQIARETWAQLYGESSLNHTSAVPIMASEDFSYYLNEIPGAFALIGADDGPNHQYACHSAYYDFNDRLLAKELGALLMEDDIQVGMERTGTFFSFDDYDPDIICLAKGLGGLGTPIAMNLVKPWHDDHWSPGEHTGNFRGQSISFVLDGAK